MWSRIRAARRFYGDVQFTFRNDPPARVCCSLNDYNPTSYNISGRPGDARLSYGF